MVSTTNSLALSWLDIVASLVRRAGTIARQHLQLGKSPLAQRKKNNEWVTPIDFQIEEQLTVHLRYHFPQHGILGEENGLSGNPDLCWVIDPLDGTTNFVHNQPQNSVSLAFCDHQHPVLGVIYDIHRDELFTATKGHGAFMDNQRIRTSKTTSFNQSLFVASGRCHNDKPNYNLWPLMTDLAQKTDGMRRSGSTALDMAWVAAGRYDAMCCGQVKFWDVAAGSVIIREAGGFICDVNDHTEFQFNQNTSCFVAANPRVFVSFLNEAKTFVHKQTKALKID